MSTEGAICVEATVEHFRENGLCLVRLRNGHRVIAYGSRINQVEIGALRVGDNVRLEMSPFDMSKGFILFKKHDKII